MTAAVFPARVVRILLVIGLSALMVAGYAAFQLSGLAASGFHGTEYPDAPPAPEFVLTDQDGRTVSLADHRGRAVLLFFGFTRCPDVCPLTLAKLGRVLDEAGIGSDRVSILLLSVDPEHDTPARLADYLAHFDAEITGLTGDPATIAGILAEYGVYAQPTTTHEGEATLAHTDLVFGIDAEGRLRVLIHADERAEIVESDIRALLRSA